MEIFFKDIAYIFNSMTIMDLKYNFVWISSVFGPSMEISFGIPFAFSRNRFHQIFGFFLIPFGIIGIKEMISKVVTSSNYSIPSITCFVLLFSCALWNVFFEYFQREKSTNSNGLGFGNYFLAISRIMVFATVLLAQIFFLFSFRFFVH